MILQIYFFENLKIEIEMLLRNKKEWTAGMYKTCMHLKDILLRQMSYLYDILKGKATGTEIRSVAAKGQGWRSGTTQTIECYPREAC